MNRRTVGDVVRVEGVGLFTGAPAAVEIVPADGGGVVLETPGGRVPATIAHLDTTAVHPAFESMPPRNTSLSCGGAIVHTVEHLLAALAGLGITDALVRLSGPEPPIADGSAALFTVPLLDAGLRDLPGGVEPVVPRERFEVSAGGASIIVEPADRAEYVYRLDYGPGSPIPAGEAGWDGSPARFADAIAPARTFCLRAEAEAMHSMGLFEHLTPREMLVFDTGGPVDNALRGDDEPARHKLLDMIGDLALVGRPIRARVIGTGSGHALNHEAARRLASLFSGDE